MPPPIDTALAALEALLSLACDRLRDAISLDHDQLSAHLLAHLGTEIAAGRSLAAWAARPSLPPSARALAADIASAHVAELARSLRSGLTLGPAETYGATELDLSPDELAATLGDPAVARWADEAARGDRYLAIARAFAGGPSALADPEDDTLRLTQTTFRRFADAHVAPLAAAIHRDDALIPLPLVEALGDLGAFGVTIPEAYGGQGLGKLAMCIVTEELARAHLGTGSLATRSEIAGELILRGGTEEQRLRWLPGIASGRILPTAVFSEPDFGSDLAHVRTRARREPDGTWRIDGAKTWATHAARADLMTLLARTNPELPDHRGLSVFLAPKSRATEDADFPDEGLRGTEIRVLGYRGMKEYELAFDGFRVPADGLLGGERGLRGGFRHLMATFESARIQTAARSVGVAQAALEASVRYAGERLQFGRAIFDHARVARKLGRMVVLVQGARQLAWEAARRKDAGRRADLEAGMAKLWGARAAWECADAGVQIHGGLGYAEESAIARILVDARVLSIFEGTSEIQATVIARRLLEGKGAGGGD